MRILGVRMHSLLVAHAHTRCACAYREVLSAQALVPVCGPPHVVYVSNDTLL